MNSQELKKKIQEAVNYSVSTRLPADVHESNGQLKVTPKHLRKSGIYINRAIYEKGKIIVIDATGKKVDERIINPVKEDKQPEKKMETKETKEKK